VIGGRVILAIDPSAVRRLTGGRTVALVSGTNGKTTTTRLLTAALAAAGPAVTNPQGSNLPPGIVAGLGGAPPGARAALEVDEAWLAEVATALRPAAITLLNLSRDQLDRVGEIRRLAESWRTAVAAAGAQVIANADDPLVVWAASAAASPDGPAGADSRVIWVGVGQPWHKDATGCPCCGGRIHFDELGWACSSCQLARPTPKFRAEGEELVGPDGRFPLRLDLPGRANRANAVMAAVTATVAGVGLEAALSAMTATSEVDGRYRRAAVGGAEARLLLAKNPAGWLEVFDMLAPAPGPVVVVINARIADGRDPSWLWDVPFERLVGRPVVASGDRSRDLSVRLRYAGVEHRRIDDPFAAVAALGPGLVDVAANYTAMRAFNQRLGKS
jgi:UDP-N-acetylmuramyl tripeptide synthase